MTKFVWSWLAKNDDGWMDAEEREESTEERSEKGSREVQDTR
jgi:hypothetical protein